MYITAKFKRSAPKALLAILGAFAILGASPATAQIETIDPDVAIDGDLGGAASNAASEIVNEIGTDAGTALDDRYSTLPPPPAPNTSGIADRYSEQTLDLPSETAAPGGAYAGPQTPVVADAKTYKQDDLIGAAEGVFGKGAEGIAGLIENLLKDQGEPNAYIVGREGGGAFILGVRYGSGTLFHKIEGEKPVYWTGPSIGFDVGANAGNTFVLVYNLHDSEDLYKRFPAGEGQIYLVGGFNASYMRRGNIVLIPIRVGAGLRLGINAGYMRFSKKHRWLPF